MDVTKYRLLKGISLLLLLIFKIFCDYILVNQLPLAAGDSTIYGLNPNPYKIIIGYSILPRVVTTLLAIVAVFFFTRFNWFNRIFMRFGAYSLQLYLFNGFLLVASRVIICKLTTNPALIISFNMLIDFFLSYLFIKYLWSKVKFFRLISGM